jgi:hypothetical protein
MLAYCSRATGYIDFAERKPKGAILIAEHPDADLLRNAVERKASSYTEFKSTGNGSKIRARGIGVPFFSVAKYPDEEDACVAAFAKRVQAYLDGTPATVEATSELDE